MGNNVLVLEDDGSIRNNIKNLILSIDENNKVLATGKETTAEKWLEQHQFDIFYIDIQLAGKKTGWDFIQKLKKTHPHQPIIIVSSTATQMEVIDAFNEQLIFLSIDKPYTPDDIYSSYEKAKVALSYVEDATVSLKINDTRRRFKTKDIHYIQKHPKKQKKGIVTVYDAISQNKIEVDISIRGSMREVAKDFKLIRCHQSYLVNPALILEYNHKKEMLVLIDGTTIPVGISYFDEIRPFI